MPAFHAFDGTRLAYHVQGEGAPLVCVPGGPMRDSVYLGDLGGLAAVRRLIMLDPRGTGQSAVPADPASYRCDRLVDDIAALQEYLDLERIDVLAHSAGANIVVQYAARHRLRAGKLVLVTPSTRAVGLAASSEMRREIVSLRRGEPWFADAAAAFERIQAGSDADEDWDAIAPFFYGRWDAAAQAHAAGEADELTPNAFSIYFAADGAIDVPANRAGLGRMTAEVLVVVGETDFQPTVRSANELAQLIPRATVAVQPRAGHFPWLDNPAAFASIVTDFLDG